MHMDSDSLSPKLDHSVTIIPKDQLASKKRKFVGKNVVTVKIGTHDLGRLNSEGPPLDSWSWRKYGQKPIKGSPHPRGYYRCSTSKCCMAKKQVEKSKSDESLLIITYTSSHNHPDPHDHDHDDYYNIIESPNDQTQESQPAKTTHEDHDYHNPPLSSSSKQDHQGDKIHLYESLLSNNVDEVEFLSDAKFVLEKELMCDLSSSQDKNYPDFYDELEELPTYSNFKSFMRNHLYDEIMSYIPIVPS